MMSIKYSTPNTTYGSRSPTTTSARHIEGLVRQCVFDITDPGQSRIRIAKGVQMFITYTLSLRLPKYCTCYSGTAQQLPKCCSRTFMLCLEVHCIPRLDYVLILLGLWGDVVEQKTPESPVVLSMGNCLGLGSQATHETVTSTQSIPSTMQKHSLKPFVGCNCYYLLTRASDPGCRSMVLETLDDMQQVGFTVIRIWAFNDGPGWMSMQPKAGVYSQQVLEGLDWLLVEAGRRGLQLMLTLTNFWAEFGGMPQYVRWSRGLPDGASVDGGAFFSDTKAQQLYMDFVTMLVTRVNSITGTPYTSDPTIHSWDLANELRCDADSSSSAAIAAWIHKTAAAVKSLDSQHLLTVGMEGFFGHSTPDLLSYNPYNVTHGVDFVREFSSPHLDFASIHMYADQWRTQQGDSSSNTWSVDWIKAHMTACRKYLGGKPLVLQEFGKKPAGPGRTDLFHKVHQLLEESCRTGDVLCGSMVWMFAAGSYPDYDGYTVYLRGAPAAAAAAESAQPVVEDVQSVAVLKDMCNAAAAVRPS